MASANLNIVLDEGSAWSKRIIWTDANNNAINLTNYWIRASVKKSVGDIAEQFLATTDEPSSNKSLITMTAASGIIDVVFSATDINTAITSNTFRSGVWDMEVTPPDIFQQYSGNYTDATLQIAPGPDKVVITANHIDAAYDSNWTTGDKIIIRGSTVDSGAADGYYEILTVSATMITCKPHVNTGFAGHAVTSNPDMILIRPNEAMSQRIIGGNVTITREVTTKNAHDHT